MTSKIDIPSSEQIVHFIGVGGIGVSALARWFLAQNWRVSGSDVLDSKVVEALRKEGVKVAIGHKKGNIPAKAGLIVRSQAIKEDNPEYIEAKKRNAIFVSYPEMIGELTRGYDTLAVAGAHGKSTTTAFLSLILRKAKLDPTVIIGTQLKEFKGSNFRLGKSKYLVLEADEFGKAFLNYSPSGAIIINIDREHLDCYKGLPDIKSTFLGFIRNIEPEGFLVLNKENKNILSLAPKIQKIAKKRKLKVFWYSIKGKTAEDIKRHISLPGKHNLENALGAFTLATKMLNVPPKTALKALADYKGSWRRFEYRGILSVEKIKAKVYDDYAHHPSEITATLQAFREKYPSSPLLAVFQPHHANRLIKLFNDFVKSFQDADGVIVIPTYRVAGRDEDVAKKDAKELTSKILKSERNKEVRYATNSKILKKEIKSIFNTSAFKGKKPVVIMMGAGDIIERTDELVNSTI